MDATGEYIRYVEVVYPSPSRTFNTTHSPELLESSKEPLRLTETGQMQDPFVCRDSLSVSPSPPEHHGKKIGANENTSVAQSVSGDNGTGASKGREVGNVSEPSLSASNESESILSPTSQASVRLSNSFTMTISPPCMPASKSPHTRKFVYAIVPPTWKELEASFERYGIASKIYRDPYYSKESDAPDRSREYSGLVYHLRGEGLGMVEEWHVGDQIIHGTGLGRHARRLESSSLGGWEYASCPPSVREVKKWLSSDESQTKKTINIKAQSQVREPFLCTNANLLFSSDRKCDTEEYLWVKYPGGSLRCISN